jgi:hypothetical protein
MRRTFGDEWSYINGNGNYAISKAVLKEFNALKDRLVYWDRSTQSWSVVTEEELAYFDKRKAEQKQQRDEAKARQAASKESQKYLAMPALWA